MDRKRAALQRFDGMNAARRVIRQKYALTRQRFRQNKSGPIDGQGGICINKRF